MRRTPSRPPKDTGHSAAGRVLLSLCLGLLAGSLLGPVSAVAQTTGEAEATSLIDRYREARYQTLARQHLQREGQFPVYPPERLPIPTDSLRPARPDRGSTTPQAPSFPLHHVRPVQRLERNWFQQKFAGTDWSYLGNTAEYTFLDTTRTLHLRARMQAQFGDPTRTLADRPLEKPPKNRTQFEYWFVVNDSIPVQIMDPMGPKGRGLIVAVEQAYRDRLRALRDTLLAPLQRSERAPHVDYYYDPRRERWYRTGYDGQSFFLEQIPSTRVVPGQRAYLDTARTPRSDGNSP